MVISTNTYTSVPTCENCGRDKQATYICDACCDKLNAMHRDLLAERNRLAAENAELRYWKQGNIRCAAQLAAANATLDRLREVVREYDDQWQDCEPGDLQRLASSVHAILYPQRSKT